MTDKHRFAGETARREGDLWNVTLLPVVRGEDPGQLENLDVRRSSAGVSRLRERDEASFPSFESQLEAVGW